MDELKSKENNEKTTRERIEQIFAELNLIDDPHSDEGIGLFAELNELVKCVPIEDINDPEGKKLFNEVEAIWKNLPDEERQRRKRQFLHKLIRSEFISERED